MDRDRFIQLSATIRVLEKKLLTKADLDRLVESRDLEEALRLLGDTVYQREIAKLERPQDYEIALKHEKLRFLEEIIGYTPDRRIVDLVALKYYYHNIKVIVKEEITGDDLSSLYIEFGDFNLARLREEIATGKQISQVDNYFEVAHATYESYKETHDAQLIDIEIDKIYFNELKKLSQDLKLKFVTEYIEDLVDFSNIKTVLRCQKQGRDIEFFKKAIIDGGNIPKEKLAEYFNQKIDGNSNLFKTTKFYKTIKPGIEYFNETGSLAKYEKLRDNYFIDRIKETKKLTYGPEIVMAYIIAKEIEVKNLRIILVSKLNGLSSSFIRERLRDSYV